MRSWINILIILLAPVLTEAQSLSSKGRFSIEFDTGCSPMTVNINQLDTFGTVTRQYYFFEGANITNETTFTYDTPGIYEIVQVVGVDNIGEKEDTLVVRVLEPLKPEILLSKCNGLEVSIESIDTYYDSIRVYFGGPDSVTLQLNETTTYSFGSSNTQTIELKGFFDNADEVCSTFFEEVIPLTNVEAPNLIAASIKETCLDFYSLYLTIDQFDSLINYQVNLSQSGTTQLFDGYLDSTSLVLSDIPFELADYCIEIVAFDPCSNSRSTSNSICETPSTLSLSPFETLFSTYTDSGIYVNLDPVGSGTFEVNRRFEGGDFESRTSSNGSFLDPIGSQARKYYYQIDYRDSCNNVLYSAETHPPFVNTNVLEDNQYLVEFTPAQNSLSSSNESFYEVGSTAEQSSETIVTSPFDLNLNAKDGTPRQFLSITSSYSGGQNLQSNTLILKYKLIVYVPTAFTPNGDGLNDQLEFFGLPTENAVIKIYSKWGQLIYTTSDPSDGWDGTINGSRAPEGTYLYEIKFETTDGNVERQKGTFALINK